MGQIMRWSHMGTAICLAASTVLWTTATLAQQRAAAIGEGTLEEIVVTARKREEKIQDVAMSVSALGPQEIQANFATDLRDLIYISPNTLLDDTNQGPGGVAVSRPVARSRMAMPEPTWAPS